MRILCAVDIHMGRFFEHFLVRYYRGCGLLNAGNFKPEEAALIDSFISELAAETPLRDMLLLAAQKYIDEWGPEFLRRCAIDNR